MKTYSTLQVSAAMLRKARALGAVRAGLALVEDLQKAPSFTFAPQMPPNPDSIGSRKSVPGLEPGQVLWPAGAQSLLVVAVEHPVNQPELDWWFGRVAPPGNRILADLITTLCAWINDTWEIETYHLPYHIEKGGTFLKDAAVLAGLGCIGRNNILVTPEYGPRVRLRALTLAARLPSTGPVAFDPCADCDAPCRRVCPQGAFDTGLYKPEDYGQTQLPGRDGCYSRPTCNVQMDQDNATAREDTVDGHEQPVKVIKYCRRCELSCPVGK